MRKSLLVLAFALLTSAAISGCAGKAAVKPDPSLPHSAVAPAKEAPVPADAAAQKSVPEVVADNPAAVEGSVSDVGADAERRRREELAALQAKLEVLYFNFDSAVLEGEARETLQRNFQLLKDGEVKVQIEGHCDERGSEEYNLALGEKRAQAAYKYLVSLGLSEERLSTISYGEEKPVVRGESDETYAKNRRAEFVVGK